MSVRVQFSSQLRAAIGSPEKIVELPNGSHLLDLLDFLASRHADAKPHLVTDSGQARPSLIVVVNDATVPAREAAAKELHDGDVVSLMPPIAGG